MTSNIFKTILRCIVAMQEARAKHYMRMYGGHDA